jgi:predicted ATPase/Flp pilus assembly protein TadD
MRSDLPTGTVTFLFTDVEGSTKLLHELGAEAYASALAEHRRVIREVCAAEGGVEVDTQGDAFFFAFPRASGAVAAAEAMTERLAAGPIQVRIGLHSGAPLLAAEGYVGDDVHFAARVASSGHGGQVILSASTAELVELDLTDLGEHRLKDIPQAVPIFQLGDGSFPPLKTISNTNLPRPASSFVGRDAEIAEVISLLRDGARLLTLSGPGGTGKTRLAIEAASELVPEFKAGVFWVGLAALTDPALVTATIAQTLGAKNGLAEHISERELLLLLDNLEQVVDAAPELAGMLEACPNLRVLATSRELLRVRGEVEYAVPPLAEAEAASLFSERSGLDPDETIAELCRRLDNLPLAVELAAARTSALTPAQILERLSQRLDLLKGGRDADPRQQTLRATIEWSYELLSPEEEELFGRFSVFAGGCMLEAVEEVCDADLDTLQSLVEKSLLRFTDGRYWMLETIREFAADQLEEVGEVDTQRRRHAEFHTELVEASEAEITGPEQDRWWKRLTDEEENFRAALSWACAGNDGALALRLTSALWRYWWQRGRYEEGRQWCEAALALAGDLTEGARTRTVYALANMAMGSGESEQAVELLEECLAAFQDEGDELRIVWTLTDLGIAHSKDGRNERARSYFEDSLELARTCGYSRGVGIGTINLGTALLDEGELDGAAELFVEALQVFREEHDDQSAGNVLGNLALVEFRRGDLDAAARRLRESIELSRLTDDRYNLAHSLVLAAALVAGRGDMRAAVSILGGTASLLEEMDLALDMVEAAMYERTLAELRDALDPGDFEEVWKAGHEREYGELLEETVRMLT